MSPDFYAGYISGSLGILIGNPLDLIKVHLQSQNPPISPTSPITPISATSTPPLSKYTYTNLFTKTRSLIRGTAAPILGYGALNALLFMTYNRTSQFLDTHTYLQNNANLNGTTGTESLSSGAGRSSLLNIWIAGVVGGFATWIISTPTEVIKCRAQLSKSTTPSSTPPSSLEITRQILRTAGLRGLFQGGVITLLRDSIGYGFYFWSYELGMRLASSKGGAEWGEAGKVLICGGVAGVVSWGSVFPLDVVKTRVQTQILSPTSLLPPSSRIPSIASNSQTPLLHTQQGETRKPRTTWQIAKNAYRTEGIRVFFRGLGVCCVRAFVVNAVQWGSYEWIMRALGAKGT